jgi:hypothetical protein
MDDFWNDRAMLTDLLFCTNLGLPEIATEMGVSHKVLCQEMKALGLNWIRRTKRKMSRGQATLTTVLQKLIPNEKIVNEYHIGEQLFLDIYCPAYNLAIEYHGRQHFDYVAYFFESYEDFVRAQKRDERKLEKCRELGITLVVFKYNDSLDEDVVYDRLLRELQQAGDLPASPPHRPSKTKKQAIKRVNPYEEEMKARRREFNKNMRAKLKEERKSKGF